MYIGLVWAGPNKQFQSNAPRASSLSPKIRWDSGKFGLVIPKHSLNDFIFVQSPQGRLKRITRMKFKSLKITISSSVLHENYTLLQSCDQCKMPLLISVGEILLQLEYACSQRIRTWFGHSWANPVKTRLAQPKLGQIQFDSAQQPGLQKPK